MRPALLAACWLAAFLSIAVEQSFAAVGSDFVTKRVRLCLKPEFVIYLAEISEDQCADACRQRTACQGFKRDTYVGCQLFTFDRCSHDVNEHDCVRTEAIWVRNQPGLPEGSLCPATYVLRHGTSKYHLHKLQSGNWNRGLMYCAAEPGLTKYADATEAKEMGYLRHIQKTFRVSYYIGGIDSGDSLKGTVKSNWRWVSCGTPILDEVWDKNQPNDRNHYYAIVWENHEFGIDDDGFDIQNHALCECIDPFFY